MRILRKQQLSQHKLSQHKIVRAGYESLSYKPVKRQFTTGLSSKTSPHFIISHQALTLNLWKKTLRYLPSLDSGRWNTQKNYLWKSQNKANRGLSWSWPFHIMLNRKVILLIADTRNMPFATSKIKELH